MVFLTHGVQLLIMIKSLFSIQKGEMFVCVQQLCTSLCGQQYKKTNVYDMQKYYKNEAVKFYSLEDLALLVRGKKLIVFDRF